MKEFLYNIHQVLLSCYDTFVKHPTFNLKHAYLKKTHKTHSR